MNSSSPIGVSSENLKEQTVQVLRCIECQKINPDGNRFCGQCGAELGRSLEETVRKRGFRDRQATEWEITESVAGRLMKWGTWLVSILVFLLTLFGLLLGWSYRDVWKAVGTGKAQIETAVREGQTDIGKARQATSGLDEQVKQLQSDIHQYAELVSQVKSHSQDLQRVEADYKTLQVRVNELNRNVDLSITTARNTQRNLGAVTSVVAKSNSSIPLLSSMSRSGLLPVMITISGFNFGDRQGHVYVRPSTLSSSILTPVLPLWEQPLTATGEVEASVVMIWTNTQIIAEAPSIMSQAGLGKSFEGSVQTAGGQRSSWALITDFEFAADAGYTLQAKIAHMRKSHEKQIAVKKVRATARSLGVAA
jgi:hypothetical protein